MTKKNTRKNPSAPRSKVRALIPLDTVKIRKSELSKLKRSKKTCVSLTEQVDHFEKKEFPAFKKWLHAECGELIQKNSALRQKISAVQNILYLTEELLDCFPQYTVKACADAAAHYIETNGDIPAGFESFFKDDPVDEMNEDSPFGSFEKEEEEARKIFESIFGDLDEEMSFDGPDPFAPTQQQKKKWAEEERCVKKLYRKIIRKLHPDRAGSSTPEQQEFWHAAKQAYESNDLETLRHIDANCDLLNEKWILFASIASIRSGTQFYKQTNTRIRRALRKLKNQPEWGFLSWPAAKKNRILKNFTEDLSFDRTLLAQHYSDLKRRLNRLRKQTRNGGRSRNQAFFDYF